MLVVDCEITRAFSVARHHHLVLLVTEGAGRDYVDLSVAAGNDDLDRGLQ